MIIPNGTIEFIVNTPGGIDTDGYPVASAKTYGEPVLCQYSANNRNYIGKANDETFTKARYSVLIEVIPHKNVTSLVRLKNRFGDEVGEFPVLDLEPLDAVCQLRLLL